MMGRTVVALICISLGMVLGEDRASIHANPIRKVVTMLQNMQSRIQEEAKKEEALYDKFMCYCKTSGGELEAAMKEAKSKLGSLEAAIKSAEERKTQTEADLKEHQTSRAEAKEAMAAATALREKEAAAFAAYKEETDTNLAALGKAITAIENGMAGGFLQTTAATGLRKFVMFKADLPDETRQEVLSFLSGKVGEDYAPQSGQITGILKQMEEEMDKALTEATDAETESIKNYEALMTAKKKEVDTLTQQIEEEMTRIGDLGVEIVSMKNDYEDTEQSLGEDTKFLAELGENCAKKEGEWAEIQKNALRRVGGAC
jgi:chromosome segregation ATPase